MPRLTQKDRSPGGVQATVLALRILELLAFSGKPGRVTDLADALGTTKNRIHRHLKTLVDLGYIVRDDDNHRYQLGIRLVQLGSAAANQYDLLSVGRPVMRRLRDALGHTVVLSKVISNQLYAIERIDGTANLTFGIVIGSPLGLHSSAQGKIVLAFGPESVLEAVAASSLEARTPATICDPDQLKAEVALVRRRGWAVAPGETMTGLNAVAVPIFDGNGQVFGTLAIIASIDDLPEPTDRHIAELKGAAREISASLFGVPTAGPDSAALPRLTAWGSL
jgi:IclR family transcriptional regulator, KDG regulon repressor